MVTNFKFDFRIGNFELCLPLQRKLLDLDPTTTVDQIWISSRGLYGQRGESAQVHSQMVAAYASLCENEGAFSDRDTRETYLLARLLPQMRSLGSRRIFADSKLKLTSACQRRFDLELDDLIRTDHAPRLSDTDFAKACRVALGGRVYSGSERAAYRELHQELLDEPAQLLIHDSEIATKLLVRNWQRLNRKFGRRGHAPVLKTVLDVFSYEARAAFHRCYALIWRLLTPELVRRKHLSSLTKDFLYLWHCEHGCEFIDRSRLRPFQGGIFALHPATAAMIRTAAGRRVVSDCIRRPTIETAEKLYRVVLIAAHHYAGIRDAINDNRTNQRQQRLPDELL